MIKAKALTLTLLAILITELSANSPSLEQAEFFESKIRPLLATNCLACHSQKAKSKGKLKAGLHLDTYKGLLNGGDSGASVVPGEPEQSRIVEAVK